PSQGCPASPCWAAVGCAPGATWPSGTRRGGRIRTRELGAGGQIRPGAGGLPGGAGRPPGSGGSDPAAAALHDVTLRAVLRKRAKAGILVEEEAPMALAEPLTATIPTAPGRKPRDDERDLFGLTHPGKVRPENQDHFLLGTVNPQVVIHGTSLPEPDNLPLRGERLATVLLVADGVGSGSAGGEASRLATESITRYVSSTLRCYHSAGPSAGEEFFGRLGQGGVGA